MTFEQSLVVGSAVTLGVVALIGASTVWRTLGRAGHGLRVVETRLGVVSEALPRRAAATREDLVEVRGESERALWTLANLDSNMESARLALADKRAASDRLRASMTSNRSMLDRVRRGARMLLRVIQMRREYLG